MKLFNYDHLAAAWIHDTKTSIVGIVKEDKGKQGCKMGGARCLAPLIEIKGSL